MAKTTAERQAVYRAKRPQAGRDGDGERRLSVWISAKAYFAIGRLARHHGLTKKELIERMVSADDERIIAGLELDTAGWDQYFGKLRVTQ